MAMRHPDELHGVSWRVHALWAALVLLPFVCPQVLLAVGGDGERVTTTTAFYGPAIATIWLAGHVAVAHVQRGRHLRASEVTPRDVTRR